MIIGVAIVHDGEIYRLPKPYRHVDLLNYLWDKFDGVKIYGGNAQGFYIDDEFESFLNRQEAAIHALLCDQIKDAKNTLFSEDLW